MVWLSYRGKGYRIHLLELGPFEAEEIVRREPMAIVLRHPLIEHYDNVDVIAMMTFYCNAGATIKHIKIYSNKRDLELYDTDGDLVDYPYYIHPNNIPSSSSYMGTSLSGTLNSSRSNSPLSGMLNQTKSGMSSPSKSGRSYSGMLNQSKSGMSSLSKSGRSYSGMSSPSKSGVVTYPCMRCVERCRRNCQRRCSSCVKRRLRKMGRQSRRMGRRLSRQSRRRSRSRYGTMNKR